MHIELKDLPSIVKDTCRSLGHNRASIDCHTADEVSPEYPADDGSRGVLCVINLETGKKKTTYGSWGGANMFVNHIVDRCDGNITLLPNMVILKGSTGNLNLLHLYASQATLTPLLPAPAEELGFLERVVLYAHQCVKSGKYRKDFYWEHKLTAAQLDLTCSSLVGKKLLKSNKNGATSITTDGRNAIEGVREWNLRKEREACNA